jgi:hypothetical protein
MSKETVTLAISDEEAENELTVPSRLLDMLREDGESDSQVIGDIAMMGLAQRIHGAVHHAEGDVDDEVAATEDLTMELFEGRFGRSFAELTGHSH